MGEGWGEGVCVGRSAAGTMIPSFSLGGAVGAAEGVAVGCFVGAAVGVAVGVAVGAEVRGPAGTRIPSFSSRDEAEAGFLVGFGAGAAGFVPG